MLPTDATVLAGSQAPLRTSGWKLLALILPVALALSAYPFANDVSAVACANGGTAITDKAGLQAINTGLGGTYCLANDVDASGSFTPIGTEAAPFTGSFDGQGHTISNLTVNNSGRTSYDGVGLFGRVSGSVRNVRLENVSALGSWNTGGLVGYLASGSITNSSVSGLVSGGNNSTGGLVGGSGGGSIVRSYSTATVTGFANTGGLVGNSYVNISDSYATGNVTSTNQNYAYNTGGLVGTNYAPITRSYSTGRVSGYSNYQGGLVGSNQTTITSNYWNTTTAGQSAGCGGPSANCNGVNGRTDTAMKQQATFSGWDFASTWGIVEGVTYPYLSWQGSPLTAPTAPGTPATTTASPNQGTLTLTWTASTGGSGAITYELDHSSDSGTTWSSVGSGLTAASYAFGNGENAQEAEGAWVYRVRASASDLTSDWSAASATVTVDRSAPTATLEQHPDQADPTDTSPVNFALVADEILDATTVTGSDFEVSTGNGTIGTIVCAGTPTTCTIPVTPSADGVVTLALSVSFSVSDLAGNAQTGAGGADRTVTYDTTPPCSFSVPFTENFDSVTAPALPDCWTATNQSGPDPLWQASDASAESLPNAATVDDPDSISDKRLDSPLIAVGASNARLSFSQSYDFDFSVYAWDGGVLEISIGGGSFTDIVTAGGSFVEGGYNEVIEPGENNPLDNRQAWGGSTSGQFVSTVVDLPPAAAGATVVLRWRMGSGSAFPGAGWSIDNISITPLVVVPNSAPVGTDNTVGTADGTPYVFAAGDFGFSDPNDDPADLFYAVRVTTLPDAGTLSLNGAAVNAGDYVSVADIDSGLFAFTTAAGNTGSPYTTFTFQVQDNGGTASGGVDLDPTPRTMSINVTHVNQAPTDIALSANSVAENAATGTTVGTLSTTDPDDTLIVGYGLLALTPVSHTYTLVTGTGDTDNAMFAISGSDLLTAAVFDFETKTSYTIRVRTTDGGGLYYEEAFTISVSNDNEAPTDLTLPDSAVDENAPSGTTVGTFSTTDPDASDAFTYSLVAGDGDTNNSLFTISGSDLLTAAVFDYETTTSYSILVRTTDNGALSFEQAFIITVTNVNEAPTLTIVSALGPTSEDTAFTITYAGLSAAADEADVDSSTVSFRVEAVSSGTLTKDGIAVTPATTLLGTGESLVWTPAANANGAAVNAFTIKAWDGSLASATAVQVAVAVTAVNDAPTMSDIGDQTIAQDGTTGAVVFTVSDIETPAGTLTLQEGSSNLTLVPLANIVFGGSDASRTVTVTPATGLAGTATITVTVSDGSASTSDTFVLTVTSTAAHPPVLTTTSTSLAYRIGDPATAIDPQLTLSDAGSANQVGATVQITNGYRMDEDVLAFTDTASITGSWDSNTATLTLTGTASLAAYQAALRSVTYQNISGSPTEATRTVTFTSDDGESSPSIGSGTRDISVVTAVAPSIVVQPVDRAVVAGETAIFTAAASDVPAPAVQWQAKVLDGTIWENIPDATDTTLTLANVSAAMNGYQYRAVFSNATLSIATDAATLIVGQPVKVTLQPGNQTVTEGRNASFAAAATGDPTPTVQWQQSTTRGRTWANIDGATSDTFTLTNVTTTMNGYRYRAVYTNPFGSVRSMAAILTVTTKAPAIGTTVNLVANPNPAQTGEIVTLTATVTPLSGSGTPTGSVTFLDGRTTLSSAILSGGIASVQLQFAEGNHPISAQYGGDASYNPSTSGVVTEAVGVPTTDVGITMTGAQTAPVGGLPTVTWTITIRNLGDATATGVLLRDTLPSGTKPVAVRAPQPGLPPAPGDPPLSYPIAIKGRTVTVDIGDLAAGGSATIQIEIDASLAKTVPTVSNTATVTTTSFDPNLSNNSATAIAPITLSPLGGALLTLDLFAALLAQRRRLA